MRNHGERVRENFGSAAAVESQKGRKRTIRNVLDDDNNEKDDDFTKLPHYSSGYDGNSLGKSTRQGMGKNKLGKKGNDSPTTKESTWKGRHNIKERTTGVRRKDIKRRREQLEALSRKCVENRRENDGASAAEPSGRTRTKNAPDSYNKDNFYNKDSNNGDNGRHEDIYDNRRPPTGLRFDKVTGLSGDSSNNDIKGRKCYRQRIGKMKRRKKGNDSPMNRVTGGEGKFVAKKTMGGACNDQTKKKHSALPDPFLQYQGENF